eukprot:1194897-Prorocentrum_minimum.AAC.1
MEEYVEAKLFQIWVSAPGFPFQIRMSPRGLLHHREPPSHGHVAHPGRFLSRDLVVGLVVLWINNAPIRHTGPGGLFFSSTGATSAIVIGAPCQALRTKRTVGKGKCTLRMNKMLSLARPPRSSTISGDDLARGMRYVVSRWALSRVVRPIEPACGRTGRSRARGGGWGGGWSCSRSSISGRWSISRGRSGATPCRAPPTATRIRYGRRATTVLLYYCAVLPPTATRIRYRPGAALLLYYCTTVLLCCTAVLPPTATTIRYGPGAALLLYYCTTVLLCCTATHRDDNKVWATQCCASYCTTVLPATHRRDGMDQTALCYYCTAVLSALLFYSRGVHMMDWSDGLLLPPPFPPQLRLTCYRTRSRITAGYLPGAGVAGVRAGGAAGVDAAGRAAGQTREEGGAEAAGQQHQRGAKAGRSSREGGGRVRRSDGREESNTCAEMVDVCCPIRRKLKIVSSLMLAAG